MQYHFVRKYVRPILAFMLLMMYLVAALAGGSNGLSREIPASEILTKVEKGEPVEYDHVTIIGDLKLNRMGLPAIRINDSTIRGAVHADGVVFSKSVNFKDSYFDGTVTLINSMFDEGADFRGSIFNGSVDFGYSEFNKKPSLGALSSKMMPTLWQLSSTDMLTS